MLSLEQVKLLESKVIKALEYIDQVTEVNTLLQEKLETYQKRIDGLEEVVQRFKEDQSRIEEGIVSALNRLNRFEADIEKSLSLEKFREDSIPEKSPQTAEQGIVEPPDEKAVVDKETEDQTQSNESARESEADNLPGSEEIVDETQSPGELDIF
ncbi:MAG: cell division protein ZapB [Spirochaetaceae bacterium]|jgi:hypothetical protein|nr:cell division protein ZapB [Spirochaetaceae bacterium]